MVSGRCCRMSRQASRDTALNMFVKSRRRRALVGVWLAGMKWWIWETVVWMARSIPPGVWMPNWPRKGRKCERLGAIR